MLNASKHEARPKISSPKAYGLRRAVEDYDFDRLEVEAQQCVKLTSTNRPFGLIIKLSHTVFEEEQNWLARARRKRQFCCSNVRWRVELVKPASCRLLCNRCNFCCRTRDPRSG